MSLLEDVLDGEVCYDTYHDVDLQVIAEDSNLWVVTYLDETGGERLTKDAIDARLDSGRWEVAN